MRVLITGVSGFAGGWLAQACSEAGDEVFGTSRSGAAPARAAEIRTTALDLSDRDGLSILLGEVEPEVIYHLASLTHVGRSWDEPAETLSANVVGAANLLEAIRARAPRARVVWVSSSSVYGGDAPLPVDEDAPLHPADPYAVSKAAAELLAGVYAEAHGLQIVRARPFNHTGPGQLPVFIVSSLAQQAARAQLEHARRLRIVTGNPDTRRDFTDVRDVVRAYRRLAAPGVAPGAYNVCTGRSVSAAEHVALVGELIAPIEVEHVVDPARVRAHEVMELRGSFERLRAATGWAPGIPLRQTVADTIAWWESELAELTPEA